MRQAARAGALILVLVSGAVQAGGPHSLTVSASVLSNCKFSVPGSTVSLALDPASTAAVTQTASVTYNCTKGNAPTFSLSSASTGSASGGNLAQGMETIPYTFSSAQNGNGNGNAYGQQKVLSVSVTVSQAAAANVTPGVYSDTIGITLTP